DVSDVVTDALAEQGRRGGIIEAVVLVQERDELGGRVLDGLVERPRVADRHDERAVVGARPADPLALDDLERELDVHRDLDPGPDDLAVALERVTVADVEERALRRNREVDGDALAEAAIVHVAALRPRGRRRNLLAAVGRDTEA